MLALDTVSPSVYLCLLQAAITFMMVLRTWSVIGLGPGWSTAGLWSLQFSVLWVFSCLAVGSSLSHPTKCWQMHVTSLATATEKEVGQAAPEGYFEMSFEGWVGACQEGKTGRTFLAEEPACAKGKTFSKRKMYLGHVEKFRGSTIEHITFPQTLPEFMSPVLVTD